MATTPEKPLRNTSMEEALKKANGGTAPNFKAAEEKAQQDIDVAIERMKNEGGVAPDLMKESSDESPESRMKSQELRDQIAASIEQDRKNAAPVQLTEIFGDNVPKEVLKMYGKLRNAKKRESYLENLRSKKEAADAEEREKKSRRRPRTGVVPEKAVPAESEKKEKIDDVIGRHRTIGKAIQDLQKDMQSEGTPPASPEQEEKLETPISHENEPVPAPAASELPGSFVENRSGEYLQKYSKLLTLVKRKYGLRIPEELQEKISEVNKRYLKLDRDKKPNPLDRAACIAIVESLIDSENQGLASRADGPVPTESMPLGGLEETSIDTETTPAEGKSRLRSAVHKLQSIAEQNRKKMGYVEYTETPHIETVTTLEKENPKGAEGNRAERIKTYLSERAKQLDASLAENIEGGFRSLGEMYNKSGWKTKLAVNVGLGVGAGISAAAVSLPAIIGFSAAIALGRAGALSSMFQKYEKSSSSVEMAMLKAMGVTALTTAGMALLIKEVAESSAGAKAAEWSKEGADWIRQHFLGGVPAVAHSGPAAPVRPSIDPYGGYEAQVRAVDVALQQKDIMPFVPASGGHGYEWMAKRLWEELQERHLDPAAYPEGSDIRQLIEANPKSIDGVVHNLAISHHFFENGASSGITMNMGLTIEDGQIKLEEVLGGTPQEPEAIPESMPATEEPKFEPLAEAPAAAEPTEDATEAVQSSIEQANNEDVAQAIQAATDQANTPSLEEMLDQQNEPSAEGIPESAPVTRAPVEPTAKSPSIETTPATTPVPEVSVSPEVLYTAGDHQPIDITKPAIYEAHAADGSSYLAAYGGGDEERYALVQRYLEEPDHQGQTVRYAHEVSSLIGKTIKVDEFGSTTKNGVFSRVLGFFEIQPKPPSPDTFLRKLTP